MSERCHVTKLLEQAIAVIRDLPDSEQDAVAEMLVSMASRNRGPVVLDDGTRNAIAEGSEPARRGNSPVSPRWPRSFAKGDR
jgi:hypothetical protein